MPSISDFTLHLSNGLVESHLCASCNHQESYFYFTSHKVEKLRPKVLWRVIVCYHVNPPGHVLIGEQLCGSVTTSHEAFLVKVM